MQLYNTLQLLLCIGITIGIPLLIGGADRVRKARYNRDHKGRFAKVKKLTRVNKVQKVQLVKIKPSFHTVKVSHFGQSIGSFQLINKY